MKLQGTVMNRTNRYLWDLNFNNKNFISSNSFNSYLETRLQDKTAILHNVKLEFQNQKQV